MTDREADNCMFGGLIAVGKESLEIQSHGNFAQTNSRMKVIL